MIQNIVNKYFFYLYVFTLFFGVLLYNTTGLKGLDVVSSVVLVVFYAIYLIGTKNRNFNIGFLAIILVFLFYLNYSFYISNNTRNAIALDFLTQLRPFVTFFIVSQMAPTFTEKQRAMLKKICFYVWLFFIPIGLLAIVNPSFLSSMMDQPSNYTACITCLAIVYLYCGNFSVKDKLTFVFMLSIGLITIQSQFYVLFLIICGLVMFFHHADVLKNNLKTGFALTAVTCLVIYISRAEILNYIFSAGIAGGGFASLASSGFYPQLNEFGFIPVNSFMNQEWFTRSVSYYPVIAQLGIIGIFLYLAFWVYIVATSIVQFKQKGDIQPFVIILILAVFVFFENISDSFFTSNQGYFAMMFIGLLLGKPEDSDGILFTEIPAEQKKKKHAASQSLWFIRRKISSLADTKRTDKSITYIIPPAPAAPVSKKESGSSESPRIIVATHQVKPVEQDARKISFDTPDSDKPVENVTTTVITTDKPTTSEELAATVNEMRNESIMDGQQLHEEIIASPEVLADEDDYEWEDELEDLEEVEWEDEDEPDDEFEDEDELEEERIVNIVAAPQVKPEEEKVVSIVATPQVEPEKERIVNIVAAPQVKPEEEKVVNIVATPQVEPEEERIVNIVAAPQVKPEEEKIVNIVATSQVEREEEKRLFSGTIQPNLTDTPAPETTYSFSQIYESLPKTTGDNTVLNEEDDFADGSYNYMI